MSQVEISKDGVKLNVEDNSIQINSAEGIIVNAKDKVYINEDKEIDVIDEVTVTKDEEVILHLFIDDLNDLKAIIKDGFEVKVNGDRLK